MADETLTKKVQRAEETAEGLRLKVVQIETLLVSTVKTMSQLVENMNHMAIDIRVLTKDYKTRNPTIVVPDKTIEIVN